jgi:hypothetical protein
MTSPCNDPWLNAVTETVASYRRMIDGAISQHADAELFARPRLDMNSVAVILRHLGGNLWSRWPDFLTTDGEKPDRDRDREFMDWEGDRESLLAHFDAGWSAASRGVFGGDESTTEKPSAANPPQGQ